MLKRIGKVLLGMAMTLAGPGLALAEYQLNLQTPATAIARDVYGLHTTILVICVVIFVGVFGTMFYSILKHRKSLGHKAESWHENTTVEIVWTLVPLLILLGMALPATRSVLDMKDTTNPDMTIKVTGYQWKWRYDYLKEDVSFYSNLSTTMDQIQNQAPKGEHYLLEVDNPMVVPVGKKVRILTTANDVIHSWSVPAFAVKQDAIPGFVRDTWFKVETPGTYRGQCSELCGKEHGFMPIVVEAVPEAQYQEWLAAQQAKKKAADAAANADRTFTLDELKAAGEKVYAGNCAACHQPTGKGVPGAFPALDGSAVVGGPKAAHLDFVFNGSKKNPAMVAFKNSLNDVDLAAVLTYERNAWGNHTGDMIQPSEVKALRGK